MNFLIFKDFSGFFLIKFAILNVKIKYKKMQKGFIIPRGSTWMRRGTPGHVAAPRKPTRRLRGKVTSVNIYIYILYSL